MVSILRQSARKNQFISILRNRIASLHEFLMGAQNFHSISTILFLFLEFKFEANSERIKPFFGHLEVEI
jgi:hypothetical protein